MAEAKLNCIASPRSRAILMINIVPTDELPAVVEAARNGWIFTFQIAATVVRKVNLFRGFRDSISKTSLAF